MAITPKQGEFAIGSDFAGEIRRIYSDAELRVIEKMARSIDRGRDIPYYAQNLQQELRKIKGEIEEEIIEELKKANPDISDAIDKAYKLGFENATRELKEAGVDINTSFSMINQQAVEALARETINKVNSTHLRILRSVDDIYREIISEVAGGTVTGAETRLEIAQRALNNFANHGVTGFIDSANRAWSLSSYAEMATRTATGRAAIQGHINRASEYGKDLVIVSDHAEECDLCRPWEGQILSISGNSQKYPALSQATMGGLFHANCEHGLGIYIEGLTKKPQGGTADPEGHMLNNQQRYLERGIRRWKRRAAAALTDNERRKSNSKVREWQARQREFIEKYDRRRKYSREQINKAR